MTEFQRKMHGYLDAMLRKDTEALASLDLLLREFSEESCWLQFTPEERKALVDCFVARGELYMQSKELQESGVNAAVSCFERARSLLPGDLDLLFRLSLVYGRFEDPALLARGCSALEELLKIAPNHLPSMELLGRLLLRRGELLQDPMLCEEAYQRFQQSASISEEAALAWHSGKALLRAGEYGGEASDFSRALDHFSIAEKGGYETPQFVCDYARCYTLLGMQIGRPFLMEEGFHLVQRFLQKLQSAPGSILGEPLHDLSQLWATAAEIALFLWEQGVSDSYCEEAINAYSHAMELAPEEASYRQAFGELLFLIGQKREDVEKVAEALEIFSALESEGDQGSHLLFHHANALIWMGQFKESIVELRIAEQKLERLVGSDGSFHEGWLLYGYCLYRQGCYFDDERYFLRALERCHQGISSGGATATAWLLLAMIYAKLGKVQEELALLRKADGLFQRLNDELQLPEDKQQLMRFHWSETLSLLWQMDGDEQAVRRAIPLCELLVAEWQSGWKSLPAECLRVVIVLFDAMGLIDDNPEWYERAISLVESFCQEHPAAEESLTRELPLLYSHLGVELMDGDYLSYALKLFQQGLLSDPEDGLFWGYSGLTALHLSELFDEHIHAERRRELLTYAAQAFDRSMILGQEAFCYYRACAAALLHDLSTAFYYLELSRKGDFLPPVDHLIADEWLAPISGTPQFRQFVDQCDE